MPHIILEYSDNITDNVDEAIILEELHTTLVATELYPSQAIKSRCVSHSSYRVGSGAGNNAFIHLSLAVLPGRSEEQRKDIADKLFEVVKSRFPKTVADTPSSITLEIRELDGVSYCKLSSIPE